MKKPFIPNPPSSMQASYLYGIHNVKLESSPVPKPGSGEVLLQIASVGVCGSDVHYYSEGRIGDQVVNSPIIMGHEFSAYIVKLGTDVENLNPGQLVAVDPAIPCGNCELCRLDHPNLCPNVKFCGTPPVNGVFTEYAVMPAENCFRLPESITPAEGALLEPLGVAIHSVNLSHIKPGDTVTVLGAGPIGLLIAKIAKTAGAGVVFMTDPLEYRRKYARQYASDICIDPINQDPVAEINLATRGRGTDIVFEASGASETPQQAAEIVRFGGKVILAGIPADDKLSFSASIARRKGLTFKLVRRMKHTYPRSIEMVRSGQVDLLRLITHRLSLPGVGEAMELLTHYRDGVIKAVIEM
jgi:L-iditol 2-dehydrogenase